MTDITADTTKKSNQSIKIKRVFPRDFIDICVLLESTVPLGPFSLPSLYFLFWRQIDHLHNIQVLGLKNKEHNWLNFVPGSSPQKPGIIAPKHHDRKIVNMFRKNTIRKELSFFYGVVVRRLFSSHTNTSWTYIRYRNSYKYLQKCFGCTCIC